MTHPISEFRQVLERVCAGSQDALEELIDAYGPHIQRVVRRRLHHSMRSKFDSIDFVQMVWASFFTEREAFTKFTDPDELLRYLATLAQRKLIQESRRRLHHQKHNVAREKLMDTGEMDRATGRGTRNTPSQYAAVKDRLANVTRQWSHRDQQIVQLRLCGAKYTEISAELGINEKTARDVISKLAAVKAW